MDDWQVTLLIIAFVCLVVAVGALIYAVWAIIEYDRYLKKSAKWHKDFIVKHHETTAELERELSAIIKKWGN
jgi:hypothetical protein